MSKQWVFNGNAVHFDALFVSACYSFDYIQEKIKMLILLGEKGNAYNTKKECFQQL